MARKPETFEAMVRREEIQRFPEWFPQDLEGIPRFRSPAKEPGYCYYPPSSFAERGLLDSVMLERLRSGDKLLSIGAGPAYLERFLAAMGAPVENIVLADLSDRHLPTGFAQHTFDASGNNWPDFGTRFDFVIYPESFSMINEPAEELEKDDDPVSSALSGTWHLIQQALDRLNPGGEMRASLVGPKAIKAYNPPYNQMDYLRHHLQRQFGATIETGSVTDLVLIVKLPKKLT